MARGKSFGGLGSPLLGGVNTDVSSKGLVNWYITLAVIGHNSVVAPYVALLAFCVSSQRLVIKQY